MKLRATITVGLATLCMLLFAPFLASGEAGAYPITTCSTLAVSTTNPQPGQSITVSGSNFTPNATVTLVLRPGDLPLATATADASGAFSLQVTLPDSITNQGHFDIVATSGSVDSSNCPADPFQNLDVQAQTDNNGGSNGGLSFTGVDIAGLLVLAAGLIGAGVLLNRKRTGAGSR